MLTLILPPDIAERLRHALRRAGTREVGGILMAEHAGPNEFVVREVSIHRRGGFASFIRGLEEVLVAVGRFFDRTKRDYRRFNYAGEWHSHPSFEVEPSACDHRSMREIIQDRSVGANFVVLMIVKLDARAQLIGTVHTYLPDGSVHRSKLMIRFGEGMS